MPRNFEYYKDYADKMVENDVDRDRAFLAYKKMYHCDYDLPSELSKIAWIHKVISTDPHDAISAGTRVLSSLAPKPKVTPLAPDEDNKERANEIERNLSWQLKSANRRRPAPVEADMVQSALTYSAVAAMVVDLDWQIKQIDAMGKDVKRWEIARRYGRFKVNTYCPLDVHVRYSDMMPEAVLLRQTRSAQSVLDEWSAGNQKLKKLAKDFKDVTYNYLMDYDDVVIWCTSRDGGDDEMVIMREKHDLDFLPWVAMMGGSTLESKPEHQYHALLYSVYQSGQWDTQNSVETLLVSEAISHAASPMYIEEGASVETTEVNAMEPYKIAKVPPGNTLKPAAPNNIDTALHTIADRIGGRIDKSTVSRILQNADVPAGTAFATLNLATQTAVGALKPYKELAEQALSEMFMLMMLWSKHTGEPLEAYGMGKKDLGMNYSIDAKTISPKNLYIDVELTPDVPTDRQQRGNTAVMLNKAGMLSKESGMDDMGVDDPPMEREQIAQEQLDEMEVGLIIEERKAELQLAMQEQQMEAQAAMEQQQNEAQAAAEQQAILQGGGQGFNPSGGGLPPAIVNPNRTREQVTGQDRQGREMAAEELV
jgi:hypothetical protein